MPERVRILFVDDEVRILEGLARMFRSMRNEWELSTAVGGAEALALLARQGADVVVSDMRMPGMDGAELLAQVETHYPATVRMVLSGQAEQEDVLRSIGPAHRFLSKPCDPTQLIAAVRRAMQLRHCIRDPGLATLVAGIQNLPPVPDLYRKLVAELRRSDPSIPRVAALIEQDPGMAAHLLHLVDITGLAPNRRIAGISEAVHLLGIDALRSLILATDLFNRFPTTIGCGLSIEWLWRHSLAVANLARLIAQAEHQPPEVAESAFAAGLLHDCGLLILALHDPTRMMTVIQRAQTGETCVSKLEQELFGTSHGRIGGHLFNLWGLPDALVEAVTFHHDPATTTTGTVTPLVAVHAADGLVAQVLPGTEPAPDLAFIERCAGPGRLDIWRGLVAAAIPQGDIHG